MNGGTGNAQDILLEAERALMEGRFFLAWRRSSRASGIIDRTQELHRRFMKTMRKMMDRISDMESRGYDVGEAESILENARSRALKSNYKGAISRMKAVDSALNRATYTPFPLLNKNVDIISTITTESNKILYKVRVENPGSEPLGELIITPFLPPDMFKEIPERFFGVIGPGRWMESIFELIPVKKDWNVGVDQEVLSGEGVIFQTRLSSREGKAAYLVSIENNSDQILRDIRIKPMAPGGLEPEPKDAYIEFVEPFGSKNIQFALTPGVIDYDRSRKKVEEKVVVIEEGEEVDDIIDEEDEWDEGSEAVIIEEEEEEVEGTDFTPVSPDYNLISMSDYNIPESVRRKMKR